MRICDQCAATNKVAPSKTTHRITHESIPVADPDLSNVVTKTIVFDVCEQHDSGQIPAILELIRRGDVKIEKEPEPGPKVNEAGHPPPAIDETQRRDVSGVRQDSQ